MSARKKKLLLIVAGVALCSLVLWFITESAMQLDRDEYARKCKSFEGVWKSESGDLVLEVRRVSSGALFFSMENKQVRRKLRLAYAYAVGDDMYEFLYGTDSDKNGKVYKIVAGQEGKGTIHLQEKKIKIDFPAIPGKKKGLEYTGALTKKTAFPEQKPYHLAEYLGTKQKPDEDLAACCSFGYDAEGKIWRIHAMLAEESEKYKTDIAGITMNSTPQECERLLGTMTSEIRLGERGWRRQYENGTYVSTVIVNAFGVITELDCQLAELSGARRQGEFIMQGDTVYRYTGDYSQAKTIELPKETRRIASHAFDAGEHGYSLSAKNRQNCRIDIPAGVFIEEDAFANCGPLSIYLKSGWQEIPEGAFAHTVSLESRFKKESWVNINLPSSLRKIGDRAFALGETEKGLEQYWEENAEMKSDPISIRSPGYSVCNISYIGENAFWGIAMSTLPKALCYLGKNYTLRSTTDYELDELQIPEGLDVLREGSLYIIGNYFQIRIPFTMKDIEEGAIRGCMDIKFRMPQDSAYIKASKDRYPTWILSRDGTVLYAASQIDSYLDALVYREVLDDYYDSEDLYDFSVGSLYRYYKDGKDSRYKYSKKRGVVLEFPKGIEQIRSLVRLGGCSEIIFPSSVQKVSLDCMTSGAWDQVTFKGKVPEIYGDKSCLWDKSGCFVIEGKSEGSIFRVKKGQKKKLLEQLTAGTNVSEEQKKDLAGRITTF